MSYARYAAAAADVEALGGTRLKWKLRQAQVELRASLPFLGDDIFVLIAAELDGCRMLGRLSCVASRFWRKSVADPAHKGKTAPELWSVAEEGARRRLVAQGEQVRGWVSRETSGGSWLRALGKAEKLQRPLRFTAHGPRIELIEDATVAMGGSGWQSAVCGGGHEMTAGVHCAHFEIRQLGGAMVGVAGPGFDPASGVPADESTEGWMMYHSAGQLYHNNRTSEWAGQPGRLKDGDVVGMVLDLDAGSLTVWLNGKRCGVMVPSGLAGPLRWAVDLYEASVHIDGPKPPPAA